MHDFDQVFDDLAPPPDVTGARLADAGAAVRKIVARAATDRVPPAAVKVVAAEEAQGPDESSVAFEALIDTDDLPLLASLHRRFRHALPDPHPVRVDTEETYVGFRSEQNGLRDAVAELAAAVAEHVADGHGGGDPDRLRALAADVSALRDEMVGAEVPLSLPPYARGKVHCWQDDGHICCSIRLPGPDGKVRVATTCTPTAPHVHDVLGYTEAAGVDVMDVLGALPTVACMLGGGALIPQLAKAAPAILSRPEVQDQSGPFFGQIISNGNAPLASVMALMQAAQGGDEQARAEMAILMNASQDDEALDGLVREAAVRLGAGQARKKAGKSIVGWDTEQFQIGDGPRWDIRR